MKYYIFGPLVAVLAGMGVGFAQPLVQEIDLHYVQISDYISQRTSRIAHPGFQYKQSERLWKRVQANVLRKARASSDQQLFYSVLRNKIVERNHTYLTQSTPDLILQWELIRAINNMRASHHLPALQYDTVLAKIAYDHALDLSTQFPRDVDEDGVVDLLSHTGSDGSVLGIRAQRRGYNSFIAENIAYNQLTAYQVLLDWSNSSSHRDNLLHVDCNAIGVAKIGQYRVMVVGKSH